MAGRKSWLVGKCRYVSIKYKPDRKKIDQQRCMTLAQIAEIFEEEI